MAKLKVTKTEYIKEVRDIIFSELGDHFITNVDDEALGLLENIGDIEEYNKARMEGSIIRLDYVLTVWLNGICFAWNYIHEKNDEIECICKEDIIPNFEQIYDDSRVIGYSGNCVFYAERPRIQLSRLLAVCP